MEHAGVRNCCVVGVNDREHSQGQYPLILLEPAEGEDIAALCRTVYADVMARAEERGKPVAVLPVDKIPMTGAMKNDSIRLGREYEQFDYTSWSCQ